MADYKERDGERAEKQECCTEEQAKPAEEDHQHHHAVPEDQEMCHEHAHIHTHQHQNTKAVINRLSRAIGHLTMVKKMVEEGRDCSEVLIQLAAVKSALNSTGKVILKDHLEHCMVDAIESGDMKEIEALNQAIDQFIK